MPMTPISSGPPSMVGGYVLERRLGGGGMGEVFLGRAPGGPPVAVKLIRPGYLERQESRRRFAREIRAARRVDGAYTAAVLDADPDGDPPWMVTVYVPGRSLDQVVGANGPLPDAALRTLGVGLVEGLAAIHSCGLVHRDLKPGNVILAEDRPRIIDFGIARLLDGSALTAHGHILGTPAYMSPEQIQGNPVGPAGDVFSLASLLTFAATGHSPFDAESDREKIARVLSGRPDVTGVPSWLRKIITACLAADPQERPALTELFDRFTESASHRGWLSPTILDLTTPDSTRPADSTATKSDEVQKPASKKRRPRAATEPAGATLVPRAPVVVLSAGNADVPWDSFDPSAYLEHNYRQLRDDDWSTIKIVRDFFARAQADGRVGPEANGLDVGTGSNLYPILSMLPLCRTVTMWEHGARNVEWIRHQLPHYAPTWDPFWQLLAEIEPYHGLEDPRRALSECGQVTRGDIFDLPSSRWDIGTMFFVAESITSRREEFHAATRRFLGALREGAPFAAAFMENSQGYTVGDHHFPAHPVTHGDIAGYFDGYGTQPMTIHRIAPQERLREGYGGIILVTGTSSGRRPR
jgi:serine/threonine protein kinase